MPGVTSGSVWPTRSGRREFAAGQTFDSAVQGRPENDGHVNAGCMLLEYSRPNGSHAEFVPVHYDYRRLVRVMRAERQSAEWMETIETGRRTTCLEVLPGKERRRDKMRSSIDRST